MFLKKILTMIVFIQIKKIVIVYNLYFFDQNIPTTDLSNCEIALFVGCETAAHATQSLHHAADLAGAKVAIGFKDSIACSDANTWTETFVDEYSKGTSVTMAAQRAAQKCEDIRLYEYDFAFG